MMPKEEDFDGINNNIMNSNYCSNDSFDNNSNIHSSESHSTAGMSKAELRKSNKPIMEKRRRARINHCLNELKALILEAMKKDPARHTKLEKADILEMTVKHLQSIQRHQLNMAIQTDPTVIHRFRTGFVECAEEVNRYVSQLDGVDQTVRQRLSNHLNNCATSLDQIGTFSNFSSSYQPNPLGLGNQINQSNPIFPAPQDVNNNGRIQMGRVQLIPSRLPSGELALIMPNSTTMPFFIPNIPAPPMDFANTFPRMSAFSKPSSANRTTGPSATQTATTTSSPPLSPVSSISSLGEDSMHTSSDFLSKTPPLTGSQNFSNAFPTPPSTESVKFISHTGHLQQPHVSSTSETHQAAKPSSADSSLPKKRLHPDEFDNSEESSPKVIKVEEKSDKNGNQCPAEEDNPTEGSNDMWRPW